MGTKSRHQAQSNSNNESLRKDRTGKNFPSSQEAQVSSEQAERELPLSRIAEHRERAGLTQKEVAAHVGVTVATISSWENNRKVEALYRAVKLCEALRCPVDKLFEEEKNPMPSDEELRAMWKAGKLPLRD